MAPATFKWEEKEAREKEKKKSSQLHNILAGREYENVMWCPKLNKLLLETWQPSLYFSLSLSLSTHTEKERAQTCGFTFPNIGYPWTYTAPNMREREKQVMGPTLVYTQMCSYHQPEVSDEFYYRWWGEAGWTKLKPQTYGQEGPPLDSFHSLYIYLFSVCVFYKYSHCC